MKILAVLPQTATALSAAVTVWYFIRWSNTPIRMAFMSEQPDKLPRFSRLYHYNAIYFARDIFALHMSHSLLKCEGYALTASAMISLLWWEWFLMVYSASFCQRSVCHFIETGVARQHFHSPWIHGTASPPLALFSALSLHFGSYWIFARHARQQQWRLGSRSVDGSLASFGQIKLMVMRLSAGTKEIIGIPTCRGPPSADDDAGDDICWFAAWNSHFFSSGALLISLSWNWLRWAEIELFGS